MCVCVCVSYINVYECMYVCIHFKQPDTDDFTTNRVANITIPSNVRNRG